MQYCPRCGATIMEGAKFCNACGERFDVQQPDFSQDFRQNRYTRGPSEQENAVYNMFNNTPDTSYEYDPMDINQNKTLSIFAYLGILFLVPLFAAPNSRFARFHINQGLIVFIAHMALTFGLGILQTIFTFIFFPLSFLFVILTVPVQIAAIIYIILGIINVTSGRAKELPFIGHFRIIRY